MRILLVRIGAIGDMLIVTPLIRHMKQQGHEVYVLTKKIGLEVLAHNPNVDQLILHDDAVPNRSLGEYFDFVGKENGCDKVIDLCESIESVLSLNPDDPAYNYPKYERAAQCNRNYYEFTFEKAGFDWKGVDLRPEYFTIKDEEVENRSLRVNHLGKLFIVWALAGSSINKTYPYVGQVISNLLKRHDDLVFVTMGKESCQILEVNIPEHERVLKMSGKWSLRQSLTMIKNCHVFIGPDTGTLHASGAWDLPKIGLLNSTTIENITKHFKNDFSIEAKVPCAPCFRIINSPYAQCPIDNATRAPICATEGLDPALLQSRIEDILANRYDKRISFERILKTA